MTEIDGSPAKWQERVKEATTDQSAQSITIVNRRLTSQLAEAKQRVQREILEKEKRDANYRDYLRDDEANYLIYELVEKNKRLAKSVATRWAKPGSDEYDELVSIALGANGSLEAKPDGLIGAALGYDPSRANEFSTYATWAVRHTLQREHRRQHRSHHKVGVPDHFLDGLTAPEQSEPVADRESIDMRGAITTALTAVSNEGDRAVLERILGPILSGRHPPSLEQIGQNLGVKKSRVSQRLNRGWGQFASALRRIVPEADGTERTYSGFIHAIEITMDLDRDKHSRHASRNRNTVTEL